MMDELGGEWEFGYGGKKRSTTIDATQVAVRASSDARKAIVAAVRQLKRPDILDRQRAAYQEVRTLLLTLESRIEDYRLRTRLNQYFKSIVPPADWASDREAIEQLRLIQFAAGDLGDFRIAAAVGELIDSIRPSGSSDILPEFIAAVDGTWVDVSSFALRSGDALHRIAGAVALVERGTDRLLTDSAFCLLAVELPLDKLHRYLAEAGWVLKSRLSFHPRAIVVQPSSRDGSSFVALRRAFRDVPSIFERIEPIFLEPIHGRWRPTDPRYPEQWQWNNDGRNSGTRGADIRAESAWNRTRGKGVRVAVIDNGIHINHPDLRAAFKRGGWFDGRTSGSASFIELSASNRAQFPTDDHGTFCAGMVGARANKQGGCGAAPECELVAIACLEDQVGTQLTLARAIAYAADPSREVPDSKERGADVISCSLGPNGADWEMSTPLELAIEFATSKGRDGKGTPIFWAASNAHVDITRDEVVSHPSVIAVSRSNNNDGYDNAAYGSTLAFVAPGANVLSTSGAASYAWDTGCSFAAPLAAGVAALVLARDSQLSATAVKDRLCDTCDKVGGDAYGPDGRNDQMGHGRINADRAVR
ncbi:MAG: S8 family serine peptidase [Myxococcales bacterium]|nr:S8 family serine peptidase [Myxococcales bacterium]